MSAFETRPHPTRGPVRPSGLAAAQLMAQWCRYLAPQGRPGEHLNFRCLPSGQPYEAVFVNGRGEERTVDLDAERRTIEGTPAPPPRVVEKVIYRPPATLAELRVQQKALEQDLGFEAQRERLWAQAAMRRSARASGAHQSPEFLARERARRRS